MSILKLAAENRNGRTVISECEFTAPLKIARPFICGDRTKVMLMTASAGMLEGDRYDIEITVRKNARLEFTGQSYTKIFKADKNGVSQNVKISVESGGELLYVPCPVIPFADSVFDSRTEVRLAQNSRFIMTDIFSAGRIAMGEQFAFESYRSRTAVYVDEKMAFLDNQRLVPAEIDLSGIGFFEGHTHCGTMYCYNFKPAILSETGSDEIAVTEALKGVCVRAFSHSADSISKYFRGLIIT